ncbi:MAG TPA: DUF3267 domain-containing protein [Gemmatimonadales bacterium]|nr:DUF3267 domain-containing protein [Gemmatimonadales bacterium]
MAFATVAAIASALVPLALLLWLHHRLNGAGSVLAAMDAFLGHTWLWIGALVVGVAGHELLHGLAWAAASGQPLRVIRFGVNWRALAPHARCTVPLPASAYRFGAAAPGVVLGIIPALAGSSTGHGGVAAFGWFMTLAAGGDFVVLWLIRNLPGSTMLQDHPTRAGCVVLGRREGVS